MTFNLKKKKKNTCKQSIYESNLKLLLFCLYQFESSVVKIVFLNVKYNDFSLVMSYCICLVLESVEKGSYEVR